MRPDEDSSALPPATSARIERAFNDGEGAGRLHLATIEIKTTLGATLAFARGFAQRYFTQLCHLGDPDVSARIAVTGTPVENRLSDLWSQFDFLNPGLLGDARAFARTAMSRRRG
jgi:hypothetical protein